LRSAYPAAGGSGSRAGDEPGRSPFGLSPAAAMMGAMRVQLPGLQVVADEWSEWCATVIENAGGYVVTVSSVLASQAVTLVSCYLADLAGPTGVSHLRLVPGQRPQVAQRVLDGLPGQSHARACLLDHVAQLRDAVGELLVDEEVGVELCEETLERASRVWLAEHD
jgi:hypothetical protein